MLVTTGSVVPVDDAVSDGVLAMLAIIVIWRYALSGSGSAFHRFAAVIAVFIVGWLLLGVHNAATPNWESLAAIGIISVLALGLVIWAPNAPRNAEAQALQRVREAEDELSSQLRVSSSAPIESQQLDDAVRKPAENQPNGVDAHKVDSEVPAADNQHTGFSVPHSEIVQQLAEDRVKERKDETLTRAALWAVTDKRMELYHTIVMEQASRSFGAAQGAMTIGFGLLVAFAVLAADAKTTTAAITVGGLGAVGASFATYIGRTFIRSQETAASHLRTYFNQPLELSRYLTAERLLVDAEDLDSKRRADILSILVQSIATAGHENGNVKETKPRGRQSRGKFT
jgi:type II secretory pathway pseudopilin PulG